MVTKKSQTTPRVEIVEDPKRTHVLDTSVLLSDPKAIARFAEHDVVLPVVVITELEAKRHHAELGYFARAALRALDDLRIKYGRLDAPIPVNDQGGTLCVELNHIDPTVLPAGFRLGDNDSRILAVAANLAAEGCDVTVVSKDLPMRVKASAVGLRAEEYRHELAVDSGWTGMDALDISEQQMSRLYDGELVALADLDLTAGLQPGDAARDLPCHTGLVLHSARGSALGRVTPDKQVRLVRGDLDVFGLHGRSAEQRIAIDLLLDEEIGIVSLGGRAGTGKSALALCAGLEAVLERRQHRQSRSSGVQDSKKLRSPALAKCTLASALSPSPRNSMTTPSPYFAWRTSSPTRSPNASAPVVVCPLERIAASTISSRLADTRDERSPRLDDPPLS